MASNQKSSVFSKEIVLLIVVGLMIVGVSYMTSNWNRIEKENNAFAKECNDRGGEAKFDFNARQCIGAKIPSK